MQTPTKLSIGIAAYNEAANIKKLLKSILSQTQTGYKIYEIIVISDGSTDATIHKVKELSNNKIKLIAAPKRLGKSARLDQILKMFKGDMLVFMDADIYIQDKLLLSKVVKTSNPKKDGIIAVNSSPVPPANFFQKVIEIGTLITREVAEEWNDGDNYLSFRGCLLALDRKFAKSINIDSEIVNNDAYLYLCAVKKNYKPRYLSNAYVYYKSPANFADHLKQSSRHRDSRAELRKYFKSNLNKYYRMPVFIFMRAVLLRLITNPILLISYVIINILTRIKKEAIQSRWDIAISTKK